MKLITLILWVVSVSALAGGPECGAPDSWAPSMAYVNLKNNSYVMSDEVDFERTKVKRLASEKIGADKYRQIHHVTFYLKAGSAIEVITLNDASSEECSLSEVDVFLITGKISAGSN